MVPCQVCGCNPCQCQSSFPQSLAAQARCGLPCPSPSCEDLWEIPASAAVPGGFRIIKTETSGDKLVAGPCGSIITTPGAQRLTINGVPNAFGGAISRQQVACSSWVLTAPGIALTQNGAATAELILFAGPATKAAHFVAKIPIVGTIDAIAGDGQAILSGILDVGNPSGPGFNVNGKAAVAVVPSSGFGGNVRNDFVDIAGTITAITIQTIFG